MKRRSGDFVGGGCDGGGGGRSNQTSRIKKTTTVKNNRIHQALAGGTGFAAKLCEFAIPV